ncbi:putative cyclic nucleotide-gated ion channel 19 [Platanthera zijinensis]|uniref:Cyclic nucleotide-gated ion channel 19 n=1 Tax=Platanthera zijinensis TaxID=2320716 RepID=A0AAP0BUB5_9ASPA
MQRELLKRDSLGILKNPTDKALAEDPVFRSYIELYAKFRLTNVAPESRVVGAGDLVDQPKKIALHYIRDYFLLDLFVILPLSLRVNQCLWNACFDSKKPSCLPFVDCGGGNLLEQLILQLTV